MQSLGSRLFTIKAQRWLHYLLCKHYLAKHQCFEIKVVNEKHMHMLPQLLDRNTKYKYLMSVKIK